MLPASREAPLTIDSAVSPGFFHIVGNLHCAILDGPRRATMTVLQKQQSSATAVTSIVAGIAERPAPADALVDDNDGYLEQVAELLRVIPAGDYASRDGANDAIGAHVRHLLEHYESLLRSTGFTDYDQRNRDREVERDTALALRRIADIRDALRAVVPPGQDTRMSVTYNCERGGRVTHLPLDSSLERELLFLVSHTVHHMALIAVLARMRGITVPESFGVAPSTLRHHREQGQSEPCAR